MKFWPKKKKKKKALSEKSVCSGINHRIQDVPTGAVGNVVLPKPSQQMTPSSPGREAQEVLNTAEKEAKATEVAQIHPQRKV